MAHWLMMRWLLRRVLVRLGSRTILGIGVTLFVLNLLIPDPIPFIDEILMLVGTILLSRRVKAEERIGDPGVLKTVGRGRTARNQETKNWKLKTKTNLRTRK
jgi:hypothetical protein